MSALVPYESESIKTPLKEKPDKEKSLKDGTLMEMDYKSCVKVSFKLPLTSTLLNLIISHHYVCFFYRSIRVFINN